MIAEISAGLSSLKAAKDILQAMNEMQTATTVNDIKLTLQGHILEAQQGLFTAQEAQTAASHRISELEQEVVRLKDWSGEKQRYQLHDVGGGAMTYMSRLGMANGEPPHWLCASCFNQGRKSFMQNKGNGVGNRTTAERGLDQTFACDTCKSSFKAAWNVSPTSMANKKIEDELGIGERCDKCGSNNLRLQREERDRIFGDLGGRRQYFKCTKCKFETERLKEK
ncbi:MAG: hypothetical protein V4618_05830 [Pseudomonadota bacterium]